MFDKLARSDVIEEQVQHHGSERIYRDAAAEQQLHVGGETAVEAGNQDRQQAHRQRAREKEGAAAKTQVSLAQHVDAHRSDERECVQRSAADYRPRKRHA